VFLNKVYGTAGWYLDKDTPMNQEVKGEWGNMKAEISCSLDVLREFLSDNDVVGNILDVDTLDWDSLPTFDCILSKSSWGVHYPLALYMKRVLEHCHAGTKMYVSLRRENRKKDVGRLKRWGLDWRVLCPSDSEISDIDIYRLTPRKNND